MRLKTVVIGITLLAVLHHQRSTAAVFEGHINAALLQGDQVMPLLYTVGTNSLRVEATTPNRPNPVDIVDLNSGKLILLFPNNRSFIRLKPTAEDSSPASPAVPAMPTASAPQTIGPTNLPGMPAMPQMPAPNGMLAGVGPSAGGVGSGALPAAPGMGALPMPMMMPPMMMEKMELAATGGQTNLLGFTCKKFIIKQRGEVMEIWATDKLPPFQPYQQNQPHRFGPQLIEEQWGDLLRDKKLFPLLAILRFENGAERYRFEVKAVKAEKVDDQDGLLFQPPPDYQEIQPLPF